MRHQGAVMSRCNYTAADQSAVDFSHPCPVICTSRLTHIFGVPRDLSGTQNVALWESKNLAFAQSSFRLREKYHKNKYILYNNKIKCLCVMLLMLMFLYQYTFSVYP